jgi:hypothetical protein
LEHGASLSPSCRASNVSLQNRPFPPWKTGRLNVVNSVYSGTLHAAFLKNVEI